MYQAYTRRGIAAMANPLVVAGSKTERAHPGRSGAAEPTCRTFRKAFSWGARCGQDGRAPMSVSKSRHNLAFSVFSCLIGGLFAGTTLVRAQNVFNSQG